MNTNKNNTATTRQCNRCNQVLPATSDFFMRDKSRPLGLSYECRECHRERKRGRDNRSDRWGQMTDEQRAKAKARNQRYAKTDKGRAVFLRKAYERVDACDMTTEEILAMIVQPCVHCGTTDIPRGLDRIDNSKPHIKGNVAPSCAPCNFARGDRFTFDEMQIIGKVIRKVLKDRTCDQVQNEGHQEISSSQLRKQS
jgi:hypothetical protein